MAMEELLEIMREQGEKNNPEGPQLAVMTGPKSCMMGDFKLSSDDLYIPDRLLQNMAVSVSGHCPADGELKDKTSYNGPLKAGDTVVLCRISEEKYVVLERVVEP